jgi:hypothetical protein
MRIILSRRVEGRVTEFQSKLPEALREFAARIPAAASFELSSPTAMPAKFGRLLQALQGGPSVPSALFAVTHNR